MLSHCDALRGSLPCGQVAALLAMYIEPDGIQQLVLDKGAAMLGFNQ